MMNEFITLEGLADLFEPQARPPSWLMGPHCEVTDGVVNCPGTPVARRRLSGISYTLCGACAVNVDNGAYGPADGKPVKRQVASPVLVLV